MIQDYVISESDLLDLDFLKIYVTAEDSGANAYHYFTRDIGGLGIITCANDECIDESYDVELVDYPDIKFKNIEHLVEFINSISKCVADE